MKNDIMTGLAVDGVWHVVTAMDGAMRCSLDHEDWDNVQWQKLLPADSDLWVDYQPEQVFCKDCQAIVKKDNNTTPKGAWIVYDWDGNAYPLSLYATEIEALRRINSSGYGKVKFWAWGDWEDS